jgi:hypothetical protein
VKRSEVAPVVLFVVAVILFAMYMVTVGHRAGMF